MTTVSVSISDDKAQRLRDKAKDLGLTLEQFLTASVEDLASRPDPDFDAAVEKVLKKNAELYRRLA
jgi:hypothetical protein